ncbi:hypothetical protein [Saccharopolyspora hordei]|uniref:DUF4352 domain-containing protein n=1 Tax=Saccharopolyspora hordei TaxID=1838 RepID=A0A853AHH2_9PSEU|nr:hypothetical protein [Saccharopolyspora hordei]NYI83448.1 hypothetical protein [Saccharopolyspora hordei]
MRVRNEGARAYNVVLSQITAQHNGRVPQQDLAAGDVVPDVEVPSGDDVIYTSVFEIGSEPGELQVSVQPSPFTQDTVYFVGQV